MTGYNSIGKIWAAVLAVATLLSCQTALAKPGKASVAVQHYKVSYKRFYFDDYHVPNSEHIIREVTVTRKSFDGLGRAAFPAVLRSGPVPLLAKVIVKLNLSADDVLTDCRIDSASRAEDYFEAGLEVSPALEADVCALVKPRLALRHGLYDDGSRLGGTVWITLEFSRWTGPKEPSSPPAMSPPPPMYWNPNSLPEPRLTFSEPEWEKFIPSLASRPQPFAVGVLAEISEAGTIRSCYAVKYGSSKEANESVCGALQSQARTQPLDGPRMYPILVRWDGTRAKIVTPQQSVPPTFSDGLIIPGNFVTPQLLPANAKVEASIVVSKDGKTRFCRIKGGAMDDRLDQATCAFLSHSGTFKSGSDIFGEASDWYVELETDWRTRSIMIK